MGEEKNDGKRIKKSLSDRNYCVIYASWITKVIAEQFVSRIVKNSCRNMKVTGVQ